MRYILSLDWDFFTGDCLADFAPVSACDMCSWSKCGVPWHTERGLLRGDSTCVTNEGAGTDVLKALHRYKISKRYFVNAKFLVAECHASIYSYLRKADCVINFDWHPDDSSDHMLTCSSWARLAEKRKRVDYRWVGNFLIKPLPTHFDLVFFCISYPWTPPELDSLFYHNVKVLSNATGGPPLFIGDAAKEMKAAYKCASS
jgi:hypothetical protein